jgi:arylsulfatase A-like enzyme
MGRNILFITTDQQRYDGLGFNGGKIARTPVVDGLAKKGIVYRRAHNQSTICMPARTTMLTGQYPRTHGVITNGRRTEEDGPSIARYLKEKAGYRTALLGKAHFDPILTSDFWENWAAAKNDTGPHRGFDHIECLFHSGRAGRNVMHYPKWLADNHPHEVDGYFLFANYATKNVTVSTRRGGATGAVQVKFNPIQREHYHTDWVADRTIDYLKTVKKKENWFVWLSFPDPHHPWDPPASELHRCDWRELDLPPGHGGSVAKNRKILSKKPRHWLEWFEGKRQFNFELPKTFVPKDMTKDQVREIDAMTHISNELIDEAMGRVLDYITERGWGDDTDVIFTTDHGEFQGDYGMLFKGPAHVDSLMRVPMVWRPAPNAKMRGNDLETPVGHVDLAPTFCEIAGVPIPDWMQGVPLPTKKSQKRERVFTEWEDDYGGATIKIKTTYRDGYICSAYDKTDFYDGTEGELYKVDEDPHQWNNLWDDKKYKSIRTDLVADMMDNLPEERAEKLPRLANV